MNKLLRTEPPLPSCGSGSEQLGLEIDLLDDVTEAADPNRRRQGCSALTILVADDNLDMRRYVGRCLLHVGIERISVVEAHSAEGALATLRKQGADLVITDIALPGADPLELVRTMRDQPDLRGVPVLVITDEATQREAQDRVRGAGAQAVLIKPFNARSLGRAVRRLLGQFPSPSQTNR